MRSGWRDYGGLSSSNLIVIPRNKRENTVLNLIKLKEFVYEKRNSPSENFHQFPITYIFQSPEFPLFLPPPPKKILATILPVSPKLFWNFREQCLKLYRYQYPVPKDEYRYLQAGEGGGSFCCLQCKICNMTHYFFFNSSRQN